MNVHEIIKQYLKENNYDGLCNIDYGCDDGCGCGVDELFPCQEMPTDCKPAYLVDMGDGKETSLILFSETKPEEGP